jgi:hypothetical protein
MLELVLVFELNAQIPNDPDISSGTEEINLSAFHVDMGDQSCLSEETPTNDAGNGYRSCLYDSD